MKLLMFWFRRDWGQFGRAYEKIAAQLSLQPGVARLVCVLPPVPADPGRWGWPLAFHHRTPRLVVVSQRGNVVPTAGAGHRLRTWLNTRLPDLALRLWLRGQGFRASNTLLWLYPVHAYIDKLCRLVPHRHTVVQIVDNNAELQSLTDDKRRAAVGQYESLSRAADCVVVSSASNLEAFSRFNPRCLLFENAVDPAFLRAPSELPSRRNGARPRLGYVGWITERTDLPLLARLARDRPQYDIVLAGPDKDDALGKLLALPNVQWLGTVPQDEVPELIASFDVCLMPHRDTAYSRSMSPLKLFQYLGSGRPIVSTVVAGVDRWRHLVAVAGSPADFVAAVDAALGSDSLESAAARIDAAARETWELRVGAMYRAVVDVVDAR
ncbi:MAG: glycosyltransferase [Burkholderiales bacterium]|nr:glycosyltransferase [Burkholderiales bacterium]